MNLRICRFVPFALIVALAIAAPAHAQDGAYDPNFGTVGRTWIDVTSDNIDRGLKLMRLPSGGNLPGSWALMPGVRAGCASTKSMAGFLSGRG